MMSPQSAVGARDSKLSSLIESPMPPVTDPKTTSVLAEKPSVKDFSRQYLNKEGMWPGKINHSVLEYRQSVDSSGLQRPGAAVSLT